MIELKTAPSSVSLPLAAGAWRIIDAQLTPAELRQWIETAVSLGIQLFDHADIYGDYGCETLFGEALSRTQISKSQIKHISKCGIMLTSTKRPNTRIKHYNTSYQHIVASVERSLSLLKAETLEVFYIHRPNPFMDYESCARALDDLQTQGKIQNIGVSNFLPHHVDALQSFLTHPIRFQQIEWSCIHHEPFHNGTLDQCWQKRLQIMAWSPLGGGKLFKNLDLRSSRVRDALKQLSQKHDVSPEQVAIAWLLKHPIRPTVILGTQKPQRLSHLVDSLKVKLDDQDWFEIYSAYLGTDVP